MHPQIVLLYHGPPDRLDHALAVGRRHAFWQVTRFKGCIP